MTENSGWETASKEKFDQMISKVPVFLRDTAQKKISKKAQQLALEAGRAQISDKDLVDAFFAATPFGFHGPMKADMESLGIEYRQFGYT